MATVALARLIDWLIDWLVHAVPMLLPCSCLAFCHAIAIVGVEAPVIHFFGEDAAKPPGALKIALTFIRHPLNPIIYFREN